jgi:hypothetical protein
MNDMISKVTGLWTKGSNVQKIGIVVVAVIILWAIF